MKKSFLLMSCIIAAFCANAQTTPEVQSLSFLHNGKQWSLLNDEENKKVQEENENGVWTKRIGRKSDFMGQKGLLNE